MRLTEAQRTAIQATAAKTFGACTCVWLFGSRVDDTRRGGGIDQLIEANKKMMLMKECVQGAFITKLQMKLR